MVKKKIRRGIRLSKYIIYKETLIDYKENFWSFAGAFIGIGLISYAQSFQLAQHENLFLIGSFGASSALIFGAIQSPLAQPRNLIGGPFISALIGVTIYKYLPDIVWLTATFGGFTFYCCDANHQNTSSSRRCNGFNCRNWF